MSEFVKDLLAFFLVVLCFFIAGGGIIIVFRLFQKNIQEEVTVMAKRVKRGTGATAQKYMTIASRVTPKDVAVMNSKSLRGKAMRYTGGPFTGTYAIEVPNPNTKRRLLVYLHEIGHILLGHIDDNNKRSKSQCEYEAEQFAIAEFVQNGIELPSKEIENGRRYIAYVIVKDLKKGRKVSKKAIRYAGLDNLMSMAINNHLPVKIVKDLLDILTEGKGCIF